MHGKGLVHYASLNGMAFNRVPSGPRVVVGCSIDSSASRIFYLTALIAASISRT
ncbi:hypothetical protein Poly24_15860 [Rosistilla carotiformis]|uniref:Uncharacterized protein n=1 Tax=Rosistilla carotiformis TaxID=2528017 RepID=A0A518JQR3_9BACT|nr:hypothetical protein Poly24_15860 [Rosistilla carotiformis]